MNTSYANNIRQTPNTENVENDTQAVEEVQEGGKSLTEEYQAE